MSSDGQKSRKGGLVQRSAWANGVRSLRTISRIVSSGASSVASTVRSAATQIVDRDDATFHDQVRWAGFDKLEFDGNIRKVLLLGYRSGFQVWDVEDAENVRDLVSRHDGPVSLLQILPKPIPSKCLEDKFSDKRPLMVICADGSSSGSGSIQEGVANPCNGNTTHGHDHASGCVLPTVVRFYSLNSQSYVHVLKFRSPVYSIRCSSRVVAISQAAQIHCFDAATLEKDYTILTNPIAYGCMGSGSMGYGPLAVGCRWMAYSGSPVTSNSGRVIPQHLTPSASFPNSDSNGSVVAQYAKESSKQLAARIVTLGDMGYKKLSRYCSEFLPDGSISLQSGTPGGTFNGTINGHLPDPDSVGMVIVRDIVSKSVIAQFKAHESPISALCFDPSGTLLVTASVQGHNINVFCIMPGIPGGSNAGLSYVHLYRLQRGLTNAVIQDISFSDDSHWIMISSSRGTSHLFAISPAGGPVTVQSAEADFIPKTNGLSVSRNKSTLCASNSGLQCHNHQNLCAPGLPITLSAVSRIRSGTNGWKGTVSGAAAAATGRSSSLSGSIASSFHNCKDNNLLMDASSFKSKYHLYIFSPSGYVIQYRFQISSGVDPLTVSRSGIPYDAAVECDERLVVVPIKKWNVCLKQSGRDNEDNSDIYGENGSFDSCKIFPEDMEKENSLYPAVRGTISKEKCSPDDRHHLYISEAELQMHQAQIPFWAKSEIFFQALTVDGIEMVRDGGTLGGELEIERLTCRLMEVRLKDLVPVYDYLQSPKYQQSRSPIINGHANGQLIRRRSGLPENSRLSPRCSYGSLDSLKEGSAAMAELHNSIEENFKWDGLQLPAETTKGYVNNNDSPAKTRHEIVNNRETLKNEAQFKFVNNSNGGLNSEKSV